MPDRRTVHNSKHHFRSQRDERRIDWVLLALLLLALLLRIWYLSVHNSRSAFFADEGDYYARAIRTAFGDGYSDDFWLIRPPLVVFWLAAIFKLTAALGWPQHILLATRLVQIALSLGVLLLLYDTGRTLYGRTAGRWAAAGWAVLYSFVRLPSLLLVENIFLALVALLLWALARYEASRRIEETGTRWLIIAGLSLGVAALARSTLLWFVPIIGLWLWLIERRAGDRAILPVLRRWAIVAGVMLLIVAPWTWRNYRTYHAFVPVDTMLGANLWLDADEIDSRRGDNPKIIALQAIDDPVARDAYGRQQGLAIIVADPAAKAARSWNQIKHALRLEWLSNFFDRASLDSEPLRAVWWLALIGDGITLLLWLLLIWGIFSRTTRGPFKVGALFWLALNGAAIVVFHSETRYLLPIYQVGLILGGAALAHGGRRMRGWRLTAALATMIGVLLIVIAYKDYPRLISNGVQRELALSDGWAAYWAGEYDLARAEAQRAHVADPDFDEPRWLESLATAQIDGPAAGLTSINELLAQQSREPHAQFIRYELLRRLARGAEALDDVKQAEIAAPADLLAWSWDMLHSPPTTTLALDGSDIGYVRGWWPTENGDRATTARADLRLLIPESTQPQLTLAISTSDYLPTEEVSVLANGVQVAVFKLAGGEQTIMIDLPQVLAGQEATFTIISPTIVEAGGPPGTDMLRTHGIEVTRATTR